MPLPAGSSSSLPQAVIVVIMKPQARSITPHEKMAVSIWDRFFFIIIVILK
jgi:hypothetical protein